MTRTTTPWMDESPPLDYPEPVEATWSLAMDRVRQESPEGADIWLCLIYILKFHASLVVWSH